MAVVPRPRRPAPPNPCSPTRASQHEAHDLVDLMLVMPRTDIYASAHPVAAEVLLLVEVSDSTARYDREIKLPLYARHGVQEVWIVDLDNLVLRICRKPQADFYTELTDTTTPGLLSTLALPGVAIDGSRLLG